MKKFLISSLLLLTMIFALVGCSNVEFKIDFVVDDEVYAQVTTGGNETIKMPDDPTKDGYYFVAWYWDKDTWQRPFTANSLLNEPLTSNMKVYAKWNSIQIPEEPAPPEEDTLTGTAAKFNGFDKINDNTYHTKVANSQQILNFSDVVEVAENSTWTLSTDIQASQTIPSKVATLNIGDNTYYVLVAAENGSVKLYTVNIRRRPIHTVTFDTDGGTVIEPQYVEEDSFANIPDTPAKTGYTFKSWNYDFKNAITANTTITTQWQPNTYKIIYHANNGTAQTIIQDIEFNSNVKLLNNSAFTNSGHNLIKWNTLVNGNGTDYGTDSDISNYDIAADLNLYAVWAENTYFISFDTQGGNSISKISVIFNSAVNTLPLPEKTNFAFAGWYTEPNGKGAYIDESTVYTYPHDLTLYAAWQNPYASGNGTANNPYVISTPAQLIFFAKRVNAGMQCSDTYFALGADINLNNIEWTPIGNSNYTFDGNFDGKEFAIKNFKITTSSYGNLGFFGKNDGVIQNLTVKDFLINVYSSSSLNIGGLIGSSTNTVENCTTMGEIFATCTDNINVGGLIGIVSPAGDDAYVATEYTITDCYANCKISATCNSKNQRAYAGGLIGLASYKHSISENNSAIKSGDIINCYATGNVSVTASGSYNPSNAGGLVGFHLAAMTNCHASGNISTFGTSTYDVYAGGLIGWCYGAIQQIDNTIGSVTSCYATGNINSIGYSGGLIGLCQDDCNINYCYATGDVNGGRFAGGLIGADVARETLSGNATIVHYNTITNCYATGNVTANYDTDTNAGGLIGNSSSTCVTNCYATGKITAVGTSKIYAGGLIGYYAYNSWSRHTGITNCFATGDVLSTGNSCFNDALINPERVTSTKPENCYTIIESQYANHMEISQLNSKAFYTDTLGWDEDIWNFEDLDFENGKTPTLKSQ